MLRDVFLDSLSGPSLDGGAFSGPNPLATNGAALQRLLGGGDVNGSTAAELPQQNESKEQKKARWEGKLTSRLKEVKDAHEKGDKEPVDKAMKSLKEDYAKARQESAELDPELEKAVKETLGESDGGGGADGGSNVDDLMGGLNDAFGGGGGCDGCNGGGCVNGGGFGGGGGINWSPPNQSPEDKAFLNQQVITDPEKFTNQFGGWYQGSEGNCATVACIKAAMDRYDDKVFDEVNRGDNGVQVRLQNGEMVSLSNGELATARSLSNFRGSDPAALEYANLCYAVAAKRALQFGNDGARDFASACHSLNNGQDIYSPAKFLGLERQMVRLNPRSLDGQDSVVAGSWKHAVFVNRNRDGSHTTDRYGRGTAYNGTDTWGNGLIDAYTFKPRELPKLPSSLYQVTANRSSGARSSGGTYSSSNGSSSYASPSRSSSSSGSTSYTAPARTTTTTPPVSRSSSNSASSSSTSTSTTRR